MLQTYRNKCEWEADPLHHSCSLQLLPRSRTRTVYRALTYKYTEDLRNPNCLQVKKGVSSQETLATVRHM